MQAITVEKGVKAYMKYHHANSRPNSLKAFGYTLSKFNDLFADADITTLPEDDVVTFLELLTDGRSQATKSVRAGHISALFNFVADTFDLDFRNPCSRGLIKKLYKTPRTAPPELLDKEVVDEIIYRANGRDRLMLELMGRAAMRIGEVLTIKPRNLNIEINTISLENPKSGRQGEQVQLHKKLMAVVVEYVKEKDIEESAKIFDISYATARRMVVSHGKDAGVELRPHDLRRHAATQASRSGVPLEMVSKVLLRHADIATTQRYLGKVSVAEASQMMEGLYG